MGEDNFKAVYKILKVLDAALDCDDPSQEPLSAEALGISENRRRRLFVMMQDAGYVTGVRRQAFMDGTELIDASSARITIKGLEYLAENSLMAKMARTAKGIADIIP